LAQEAVRDKLKHEIGGVLWVAVALFLFLALVSYDPIDHNTFFSYNPSKVKNWMGVVGPMFQVFFFRDLDSPLS